MGQPTELIYHSDVGVEGVEKGRVRVMADGGWCGQKAGEGGGLPPLSTMVYLDFSPFVPGVMGRGERAGGRVLMRARSFLFLGASGARLVAAANRGLRHNRRYRR